MSLYNQVVGQPKVHGAAYPGIWVEKQVTFIKLTFSADISAIPAASLWELGTTTLVSAGTVADGSFGVVESVLVQALETLELDATVLGISQYNTSTHSVDVMLGYANAWVANNVGVIATGLTFGTAEAMITTAGSAPADAVGTLVSVNPAYATFSMEYVYMDGSMPVATLANGALEFWADGNGPGTQANPMGLPGYYPVDPYTA